MAVLLRHALRRLRRRKGYVALNVLGLALGLATAAVLLLFVRHETRYDAHHPHAERTALLALQYQGMGGRTYTNTYLPAPLAEDLVEVLPAVERAVRVQPGVTLPVRQGAEAWVLEGAGALVDPGVLEVFALPLLAGDPGTALADPDAIVLDEPTAHLVFGPPAEAALGETLEVRERPRRVTGILAPVPATSHWRPRVLLPIEDEPPPPVEGWSPYRSFSHKTYVVFREGADVEATLALALAALGARVAGTSVAESAFGAQPVRRIHLHGENPWGGARSGLAATELDRAGRLRVLAAVALLILVLAGVNYVNLATAYGLRQAREVGVRKTLGAGRVQLAALFLVEAVVLALGAGALALAAVPLALPFFNEAVQTEVSFAPWREPGLVAAALGLALGVGVLAGVYPAAALSRPSPAAVFRGGTHAGAGGARVRRSLVVFQFAVAVLLVASTLVMGRQVAFMQQERLGLEPDGVLVVEMDWVGETSPQVALEDRLRAHTAVEATAAAWTYPGGPNRFFGSYTPPDAPEISLYEVHASETFRMVLGMELLAGSDLPPGPHPEGAYPVLINETAAATVGWSPAEAVGRPFPFPESRDVVAGVVRDFQYGSMREAIQPAIVRPLEGSGSVLLVRFRPGETADALRAVEAAWAEAAPGAPLRMRFVDEQFEQLFTAERRLAGLFSAFSLLAVFIACLGLFGLAAYAAERRTKEVGIRKVLGASVGGLVARLSGEFVVLVAIAFAVAVPLAYWAMGRWLEGFAYRVTLGPGVFLAAGALALLVASLAVGFHALRAATADPVRALRSE